MDTHSFSYGRKLVGKLKDLLVRTASHQSFMITFL